MWRSSCEQYRSRPARRPRPCDERRFSRHELRRAEPVEVVAADGERLLAPFEVDLRGFVVVPADVADGAEVDDDGAMHLRELVGIELAEELLERRADHGLAAAPDDHRVLRVGTEIVDLVDGDQAQRLPRLRANPAPR